MVRTFKGNKLKGHQNNLKTARYKKNNLEKTPAPETPEDKGAHKARSKFPKISAAKRGYDYEWQKFRKKFLSVNPLCVFCKRKGIIKAATVVDHITPHKGSRELFYKIDNLQALCTHCHNSEKQKEERKNI